MGAILRRKFLSTIDGIGAPGTVFSPSYANCALWLMADVGITLIGGQVQTWADQSANHRDYSATGGGVTTRPDYLTTDSVFAGRATIKGTAGGRLWGPSFSALTGGAEGFLVIAANTSVTMWRYGTATTDDIYNTPNNYTFFGSASGRVADSNSTTLTGAHILSVASLPSEYTVRVDGTQTYTRASNTVGWDSTMSMLMGDGGGSSGFAPSGAGVNCKIAAMLIIAGGLTTTDRNTVISGLKARYGIA